MLPVVLRPCRAFDVLTRRRFALHWYRSFCQSATRAQFHERTSGDFRRSTSIQGVTLVCDEPSAKRALAELERLTELGRIHAWDTEVTGLDVVRESPVHKGRVVCATCYAGDDADFGNGPRLFIDNDGPAAGMLEANFAEYFGSPEHKKVFHNYSFDRHVLERCGLTVRGFFADTLHMARLYDTSLSSWEGHAQRHRRLGTGQFAKAKATPRMTASALTNSGAQRGDEHTAHSDAQRRVRPLVAHAGVVMGVTLGSRPLEHGSWASASQMHTLVVPETDEDEPKGGGIGYGLKNLASHFDISNGGRSKQFSELFGHTEAAAAQAHNCPATFPSWVLYATTDAVLTYRLFEKLFGKLSNRRWSTAVHSSRAETNRMLADKTLAKAILQKTNAGLVEGRNQKNMWNFYELYLRDVGECLYDLEMTGVAVNLTQLAELKEQALTDLATCHQAFVSCFESIDANDSMPFADAKYINIGSSMQLRHLLFGGVGINRKTGERLPSSRTCPTSVGDKKDFVLNSIKLKPGSKRSDYTECGFPSAASGIISGLVFDPHNNEIEATEAYKQLCSTAVSQADAIQTVQGLRNLQAAGKAKSLCNSFIMPLIEHGQETGRIHPSWAFDTATGRLACRRPNLQNLPTDRETYQIRDAFQAGDGNTLVVADYSQLELRVLAHMSQDESMIEALSGSADIHSATAMDMFPHVRSAVDNGEVSIDDDNSGRPTVKGLFPKERGQAKAINFGIVYGKEASTLSEDLGIEKKDAEALIEKWFSSRPGVLKWKKQLILRVNQHQYVESLFGRWRLLPLAGSSSPYVYRGKSERAGINFCIQGSAADIVLAAMLRIWRSEVFADLGFRLVLQIHDEFVLEGPSEHSDQASAEVRRLMQEPFKDISPDFSFLVPMSAEVAAGSTLLNAKP